ncbi:MAG: choice-of-anchor L domain-containing protein [Labilithrix sp.]|nr:choice-of-anchor L domain-containing protein [Labilithrix sp.]
MISSSSFFRSFVVLGPTLISLAACTTSDLMLPDSSNGRGGDGDGSVRAELACSNDPIPPPRDLPPSPNGSVLCLKTPLKSIASAIGRSADELQRVDADVLVGDCIDVETPAGLTLVVGAALRKDESGEDYARDVRLPLPSAVIGGTRIDVETGTTLLVAKVAEFRGERLLRFVNVATVKDEGGERFIETLPEAARREMSSSMKVDGPGLYAFYLSSRPVGFVSGAVTKGGAASPGAVVIGTSAPFLTVADGSGAFTLPLARGDKASLAAYELATRWTGEAHLPVEEGGKTNPKTEAPVETPATEKPIAGLDALNLTGVTLSLEAPGADGPSPASDFEDGALGSWTPGGAVSVLDEKTSTLFPATKEQRYAFLTTGAGSIGGKVSRMTRELTIPASAKELVIDYTLLSQEYPGWVGTIYNDAFVAYVAGDTRFLLVETVTGNQGRWMDFFQPVGNVVESSATVGGVDKKFGGTTGARTKRVPVTGCEGKTITLVLGVSDVGDSIYDTAVAIDRVAFE